MPIRPDESADGAAERLERLIDASFEDWRARLTWRRRQVMDGRSGALDLPGTTWRARPWPRRLPLWRVAPGCLSEVSVASAIDAAALALEHARRDALRPVA